MMLTGAGQRRHYVTLQNPGTVTPDGDGGYTATTVWLQPPTAYAFIQPATARDLERVAAGTVIATSTHVITLPYHAGVTTQTVITYNGRRFAVTGVSNPEEQNRETICTAVEVVA